MNIEKSGIEVLLDDAELLRIHVDLLAKVERELGRREGIREGIRQAKSRAGKASSNRYSRLRALAFNVYSAQCSDLLVANSNAKNLISLPPPGDGLLKLIRPSYSNYHAGFLNDAKNQNWNEVERSSLYKMQDPTRTDTTLYGYWRSFNKDLKLVLENMPL